MGCALEKVSNCGWAENQFSCLLFAYFSLVAVWVIHSQMEVIQIHGWHEFFIICIFFLMAAQMFNSSTDWLFNIPWWLTVPLAQPAIGCLFSNGGWQCLWLSQNWLPNLTLAGNQDTRIQYFFYPCLQAATCQVLSFAENPRWSQVWQYNGLYIAN